MRSLKNTLFVIANAVKQSHNPLNIEEIATALRAPQRPVAYIFKDMINSIP
jgi:hypothetical protein